MKLNLITPREILDYEKEIGYELVVTERPFSRGNINHLPRYYAKFEYSDVMEDNTLIGYYGDGDTIDAAIQNYCDIISNRHVAFSAYSDKRKNIYIPKLVHTKLLGY